MFNQIGEAITLKAQQPVLIIDLFLCLIVYSNIFLAAVKSVKGIKFKGALECEACKYIVSSVESLLKDKRTEESVLDALDKVCEMVPSTYRDEVSHVNMKCKSDFWF